MPKARLGSEGSLPIKHMRNILIRMLIMLFGNITHTYYSRLTLLLQCF